MPFLAANSRGISRPYGTTITAEFCVPSSELLGFQVPLRGTETGPKSAGVDVQAQPLTQPLASTKEDRKIVLVLSLVVDRGSEGRGRNDARSVARPAA